MKLPTINSLIRTGFKITMIFLWSILTSWLLPFEKYPMSHLATLVLGGVSFLAYVLWEESCSGRE